MSILISLRFLESNLHIVRIHLGNGLTPNRRQAITCSNDNPHYPTYMRHRASMS